MIDWWLMLRGKPGLLVPATNWPVAWASTGAPEHNAGRTQTLGLQQGGEAKQGCPAPPSASEVPPTSSAEPDAQRLANLGIKTSCSDHALQVHRLLWRPRLLSQLLHPRLESLKTMKTLHSCDPKCSEHKTRRLFQKLGVLFFKVCHFLKLRQVARKLRQVVRKLRRVAPPHFPPKCPKALRIRKVYEFALRN